jgi:aspartyl/asparaginyl beta-hydroxylase (cupin superfamily)
MRPLNVSFFHDDSMVHISSEPTFYNLSENPTIKRIMLHYSSIRIEAEALICGKFNVEESNPNAPNSNTVNAWTHSYFLNYMLPYSNLKQHLPYTASLLLSDPNITLCGIARLKAGGRLLPHCGETNAIIRCHVGLKVPGKLPEIGIRVKDEMRCWEEGKILSFNDAYNHEAWNHTGEDRFVLIFDLIKPELLRFRFFICAYCLGIAATRIFLGKIGLYKYTPIAIRKSIALPLAILGFLVIAFFDFFKKYSNPPKQNSFFEGLT